MSDVDGRQTALGMGNLTQQTIENSKMGIEGVNHYQVLGMIS